MGCDFKYFIFFKYILKTIEHEVKEDTRNGRTAINIPSCEIPSPKSPQSAVEKRNSFKFQEQKEHREHNGSKSGNLYNNNKVNSACLNNLILPLLSEVSTLFHISSYFITPPHLLTYLL